ncbi:MAG: hypothetical protein AB7U52_06510, partial [Candidatus Izemoplasmatales bacterium]
MNFKDKSPKEKRSIFIVLAVVLVLLLVSILGPIIFPNTAFSTIVENSVGKFFNLFNFFKNNYIIMIETVA